MSSDCMCYAASKEGWPGYVSVCVDEPQSTVGKEILADFFKDAVKRGYRVERVTRDAAVVGMQEYSAERKRRALSVPAVEELPLFGGVA
jgi:hypothetical protein